jgi:hypothetical protein
MNDDLTKNEAIELILSNLNIDGWKGGICLGCKPKNDSPYPATVNIEASVETWKCPRCGFINLFTFRPQLPIFLYPDYGVLGSVIISAYEELEIDLNLDLTTLSEYGKISNQTKETKDD